MSENIYDESAGVAPCGVDGCEEPVGVLPVNHEARIWRVKHGLRGEAVRDYDADDLFVGTGYAPWAREVHAYDGGRR